MTFLREPYVAITSHSNSTLKHLNSSYAFLLIISLFLLRFSCLSVVEDVDGRQFKSPRSRECPFCWVFHALQEIAQRVKRSLCGSSVTSSGYLGDHRCAVPIQTPTVVEGYELKRTFTNCLRSLSGTIPYSVKSYNYASILQYYYI